MSSPEALPPNHPSSDPGAADGPGGSDPLMDQHRDDTDGRPSRRGRRGPRRGHRGGPFLPSAELGAFGPYGDRGERAPYAGTSDQPAMTDGPHRGRGRHGGPPEGFDPATGQPFGPGFGRRGGGRGHGGGRGRGGPRPRRGDVRLAVLRLLSEEPMHGYQIITELGERSGGVWRPSPGSIYPTLQVLADEGLVTSAESEGRRVFTLTDAGKVAVTEAESHGRRAPWDELADDADRGAMQLRDRLGQVMGASAQVAQIGTPGQIARAEQILTDTRKALYGLLAEDDESLAEGTAPDAS
jgi:DNA-binding PadR family transcriptional regulator